jgi:RimJ/RimL family protein N-acetyltransferase
MRLTLRPSQPDDAEAVFSWRADAVARGWMTNRPLEQLRQRLLEAVPDLRLEVGIHFWIAEVDGMAAGQLILKREHDRHADAELGYVFAPEMRGKGIAELAVRGFIERILAETPVRSLLARVKSDNEPSRKFLERLAFERIGGRDGFLYYRWSADGPPHERQAREDRPL